MTRAPRVTAARARRSSSARPTRFAPRAEWVLETLLAPLGRRARGHARPGRRRAAPPWPTRAEPVAGVPTIPCDAGAMELLAAGRPLPAGAFAARGERRRLAAVAAWPADPGAGFAVPFDLVASAFVLLACWDERTTAERDKYGRLPFSASVFAANPELTIDEPAVDRYAELLRGALAPRLAELGLEPLPRRGGASGERAAASPSRSPTTSTTCGAGRGAASPPPATARARAARHLRRPRRRAASSATAPTGSSRHLPRRTDPFWTFPQILARRGRARRLVDLLRDRPPHAQAGRQPAGDVPRSASPRP